MTCASCLVALSGTDNLPSSESTVCTNYGLVAAGAGVIVGGLAFLIAKSKLSGGMAAGAGVLTAAGVGLGMYVAKDTICAKFPAVVTHEYPLNNGLVMSPAYGGGGAMQAGPSGNLLSMMAADAAASQANAQAVPTGRLPSMPTGISVQPPSGGGMSIRVPTFKATPADPSSSIRTIMPLNVNAGVVNAVSRAQDAEAALINSLTIR